MRIRSSQIYFSSVYIAFIHVYSDCILYNTEQNKGEGTEEPFPLYLLAL